LPKITEQLLRFDCRFPNWPCALVAAAGVIAIAETLVEIAAR
jgi:hypothetical protein